MTLTRRTVAVPLALVAVLVAGCASNTSAPGNTPPSGPALAGTPTAAAGSTPAVADGNYAFELSNSGFTAQLLLGVRQNTLVISQLTVTNNTGGAVNAVPRVRYLDAQQRTFDAITEPDWRALYPEDSLGLLDGKTAQIRVGFTQGFNPQAVTFCLNLGPQDMGCFKPKGGETPAGR
jgi:hypothetical protein